MSNKKITIKDIARNCGVGLGTVSRVINAKPGVKEEVRRKVLQYVEDIGWRCNTLSQRLKLPEPGKTVIIIASTSILERKYDHDLLRIMLEQLIGAGFSPLTLFGQCRENLERCRKTKPYAVIVAGTSSFQKEATQSLLKDNIRIIGLGECDEYAGPIIFPDYRKAAGKAVQLLLKAEHQHIGFFGGMGIIKKIDSLESVNLRRIREMLTGITEKHKTFNLSEDAISDCFCDLSGLNKCLKSGKHSAWICSDEKMVRQFLQCATELKIRIPEDLSVIGFTPELPSYSFTIDLTRFYPDNQAQAAQAMALVQGKTSFENQELVSDCLYHAGRTV